MALSDDCLWKTLSDFQIGAPDADLSFSTRLATENGWSQNYADRVVEEYRRFLYLAMRSERPVTPSDQVDQAWHLHLSYTKSYWDELCAEVLERPLHHDPTKGGSAQQKKFSEQYEFTLAAYRKFFGEDPPADIWPPTEIRFSIRFRRVDISKFLFLPRPRFPRSRITWSLICLGLLVASIYIFIISVDHRNAMEVKSPSIIIPLAVMTAMGAMIGLIALGFRWIEGWSGAGGDGCGGGGCGGG